MNIVPSEEENVYFLKAAEILACFYLETYKHTVTKEWYKKTNGGKLSFQAAGLASVLSRPLQGRASVFLQ